MPWDVLADPKGNEFCVLRPGHPGVLADSGLVAVCLDVAEEDLRAQAAFWESRTGWHAAEHHDRCTRLRRTPADPVALVMGPPSAPKEGRNRIRLEVAPHEGGSGDFGGCGEFLDVGGNEFHVTPRRPRAPR